jgi:mono/diheme cytochrome c family protein
LRRVVTIVALLTAPVVAAEPQLTPATFKTIAKPFLTKYCVDCHGPKKQKAKRRFDQLSFPIADDDALVLYQEIVDLLNLGEMPPEDEPQPSDKARTDVVSWMTAAISEAQAKRQSTGGETVLRRLSRREYRHTIADLFDLDMEAFDPTTAFPADQKVHHLDNQGDALVTSGFLLARYVEAAETVLNKAMPPLERPKPQTWAFAGRFYQQAEFDNRRVATETQALFKAHNLKFKGKGPRLLRSLAGSRDPDKTAALLAQAEPQYGQLARDLAKVPASIKLFEHPKAPRHMGGYAAVHDFREGVPHDGHYRITLEVDALHRQSKWAATLSKINPSEPQELAIVPGDRAFSDLHLEQQLEPELARFSLKDGRQEVSATVWLHRGSTPRFTYPNGSDQMRSASIEAARKMLEAEGKTNDLKNGEDLLSYGITHAELPQIRIYSVKIEGPIIEEWPRPAHQQLLGGQVFDEKKNYENVERFLGRAYRRPATKAEISRIIQLIEKRQEQGQSPYDAFRDGLKAALCSPNFIYFPEQQSDKTIDPYDVATRLSYFLWASTPDEELLRLAADGSILKPKVRVAQMQRMLRDPKSHRFVQGFLDSWLTLSELGSQPPDPRAFKNYYQFDLESAMRSETVMFTRHLLDENLSVDHFIDSDFTFANGDLARHYGLPNPPQDNQFKRVTLPKGSNRGGLLGQASILTVSANGIDTSPIVRGVWLLENLLGTPPSPPPPDVEPLDPDVRGAKSIRDQLQKHRNDPACAECHRKIDPLGFALENFDPVGAWRKDYGRRVKIDASGKLPGGAEFRSFPEFKAALLSQQKKFRRGLTKKLMSYALGRSTEISDRPEIDAILADLDDNNGGFRYLVQRIVASPNFTNP